MNSKKVKVTIAALVIALAYAIIFRLLFGVESWGTLFSVMSITFLFCLPVIVGLLTVYFSDVEKVQNKAYRIFAPWIPIGAFFVITLLFSLEGWACWLMVLPLFLIAASIGGLIGAYFKLKKKDKVYISVIAVFPLILSPVENLIGAIPGTYKAYTYIDVHADAVSIWNNVTRVKEIKEEQDSGWLTKFLGFPRPVKAELNYDGVGAYRKAVFTNGLVFHETVLAYDERKKMIFSIKANPYEIPSATLDKHVVVGGDYFDVLNGTYELQKLDNGFYRLHLYSHFKLSTTFNFYASWWARWIMEDIQNNILKVIKKRAESKNLK